MGRHSAPDEADDAADDAPDDAAAGAARTDSATATLDLLPRSGRHATPEERAAIDTVPAPDEQLTQRIAAIDVAAVPSAEPALDPVDLAPVADDAQDTDTILPLESVEVSAAQADDAAERKSAERAAKRAAKAERKAVRGSDTKADLRLLRTNGAVRAQAIGAVVASFLLYTLVMLVIGRTDSYARWIWVPIVVSGVLVGLVLDLAHRRGPRPEPDSGSLTGS